MTLSFCLLLSYYRNNDLDRHHFLRIKINDCLCFQAIINSQPVINPQEILCHICFCLSASLAIQLVCS